MLLGRAALISLICIYLGVVTELKNSATLQSLRMYDTMSIQTDLNGVPVSFTDERISLEELRRTNSPVHISVVVKAKPATGQPTFYPTAGGRMALVMYLVAQTFGRNLNHHGIYFRELDGKLDQVADFGGETEQFPVIRSLDDFMYGDLTSDLSIRRYTEGATLLPENIESMAMEIGNNSSWGKYDWVCNNCEHFATFMIIGKAWSQQSHKYSIFVQQNPFPCDLLDLIGLYWILFFTKLLFLP